MIENGICEICGGLSGVKKVIMHHLTYEPTEMLVKLCIKCHKIIHFLSKLNYYQRKLFIGWIDLYGSQWVNCGEKYKKSNRYKEIDKKHNEKEKIRLREKRRKNGIPERKFLSKEEKKQYLREYYLRNKEKIINRVKKYRIENLENVKQRQHEAYLKRRIIERGLFLNAL